LDLPIMIGGYHLTALPHKMPKEFDVGIVGEGEQVLLELVNTFEKKGGFQARDLSKIKSTVFWDNGKIKITERRGNIQPLDKIPFPSSDLLPMQRYYLKPARHTFDKLSIGTSILTTRGCMYDCVFCSQTGFWQHTMRFFSPEYVVAEMREIVDNYKIDMLRIMDDLFAVNKKRVAKIAELMKKEGITDKVELHVFGRTNLINEEMCRHLRQMNVRYINFGLESGSERILRFLKKGSVTVEQHKRALDLCKKHGLLVDASFIFGTPGETKRDIQKTFELVRHPALKNVMFFKLTPLPASAIWDYALKRGLVSEGMDWNDLDAAIANPRLPHLNNAMSKEEYMQILPEIVAEYRRCNYTRGAPKIKLRYLFNKNLIKRFLSNWKGYSLEFIYRIKQKYFG
ncbi:MAG: radical SAM protein, partial [Candidatus Diapherotrites archaeon]|nr:radical SAM protein [Candidatus Diapherotrites archaeon]